MYLKFIGRSERGYSVLRMHAWRKGPLHKTITWVRDREYLLFEPRRVSPDNSFELD